MLRSFITLFAPGAVFLLFAMCRKTEVIHPSEPTLQSTALADGLPRGTDSLNGVLYVWYHSIQIPGVNARKMETTAIFRDPSGSLVTAFGARIPLLLPGTTGNVAAGRVTFNNTKLTCDSANNEVWYRQVEAVKNPSVMVSPRWRIEGNKTFKGFEAEITRQFPEFSDSTLTLSHSQGLAFAPHTVFRNYDSVHVAVRTFYNPYQRSWTSASSADQIIQWDEKEIAGLDTTGSHVVIFCLFNYSHITIENKKHVFILAQYAERPVNIVP